jgi:hypothetical protein
MSNPRPQSLTNSRSKTSPPSPNLSTKRSTLKTRCLITKRSLLRLSDRKGCLTGSLDGTVRVRLPKRSDQVVGAICSREVAARRDVSPQLLRWVSTEAKVWGCADLAYESAPKRMPWIRTALMQARASRPRVQGPLFDSCYQTTGRPGIVSAWFTTPVEQIIHYAGCHNRTLFQLSAYIVSRSSPDSGSTVWRRSLWVSKRHDHATAPNFNRISALNRFKSGRADRESPGKDDRRGDRVLPGHRPLGSLHDVGAGNYPAIRLGRRWIVTRHAFETWERNCGIATGLQL